MPIKDSLSKIGKYIEDGVSNVAYKSENLIEVSKVNMSISSEEKQINEICLKIGKRIYNDFKEGKIEDKALKEKCEEIQHIEKNIDSLKKKMLKLKEKKICKKCNAEMDINSSFCPKCGKEQ